MSRKYFYIVLLLAILCFFVILIYFSGGESEEPVNQDISVENPPFLTYISGSGIVEPISGNIAISSPLNRIIERVNVKVNDRVRKGAVLFQLYRRDLQSHLTIKQTLYQESLSYLHSLEALPREEDLTIAQENFNKAQAALDEAWISYRMIYCQTRNNCEKRAAYDKYLQIEADYFSAQAQLEKVQQGTWAPELKIAQDKVEQARASLEAIQTELEQTNVKSPIDATVLQVKIREGEFYDPSKTAVLLGNIDQLNLRVSIDQFNGPRFRKECSAVAFKQGDVTKEFPLEFLYIEPLMIPKKYLTNELHEKVDTQTFEVLYRIKEKQVHLFIGEQMDVYIYVDKKEEQR